MRASEFIDDAGLAEFVDAVGEQLAAAQRRLADVEIQEGFARTLRVDEPREPHAGMVYGAAVVSSQGRQAPAFLLDLSLFEGDEERGLTVSERGESLLERLDLPALHRGIVPIPVGTPRPQFAPGAGVTASGARGTLGARVTSAVGEAGILTAGHLTTKGSLVHDLSDQVGHVAFSVDPAQVPALTVTADIAVIVPFGDTSPTTPVLYRGAGPAAPGTPVTVYGAASGVQHAQVMGLVTPSLFVPSMAGQWASTYILTRAVSRGGDSGAPVVRDDTSQLIGHVVGGDELTTTFVQSIDVQLAAATAVVK